MSLHTRFDMAFVSLGLFLSISSIYNSRWSGIAMSDEFLLASALGSLRSTFLSDLRYLSDQIMRFANSFAFLLSWLFDTYFLLGVAFVFPNDTTEIDVQEFLTKMSFSEFAAMNDKTAFFGVFRGFRNVPSNDFFTKGFLKFNFVRNQHNLLKILLIIRTEILKLQ